ncbi:MAG TPA: trypsin-like peptidase domain-containing protein [Gammaproteobacteria bacterium]
MKRNLPAAAACVCAALASVVHTGAWAQARNRDIPDPIREIAARIGAASLEVARRPEEDPIGRRFVVRVQFPPEREGFNACPDHYPAYFVPIDGVCPSLDDNAPPAPGWTMCHGMFYAPEEIGCPEIPPDPVAPATIPAPRCDFSPERCELETPGGPVPIRSLEIDPAAIAVPRIAERASPIVVQRAEPAAADRTGPALEQAVRTPAPRTPAAADRADAGIRLDPTLALPAGGVRLEAIPSALRRLTQIRDLTPVRARLRCAGGRCGWGGGDAPITLPRPPVTPIGHVPCEYEYASFFVPENRFCPREEAGERPAPGTALFISWSPERSEEPPNLFYSRSESDGIPMTVRMIIGDSDDRFLITEATDRERAAARSTAMLIKNDLLSPDDEGFVTLRNDPAWRPLCRAERFADLPQPGRCSGVKIGDRLVATSAHCVRNARQCAETSAVFGFFGDGETSGVDRVPASNVYQCTSIVASRRPATIGERGADWTIFEVDRDIDAPTAALAGSSEVRPSIVTTVIGHPLGLPSIVTRFGVVQVVASEYFIANSDTFVGNSGSAVFAAQSVEDDEPRVLGLLTGGGYDFVETEEDGEPCVQAKWCRGPECFGDDVIYADDLIEALLTRDGAAEED